MTASASRDLKSSDDSAISVISVASNPFANTYMTNFKTLMLSNAFCHDFSMAYFRVSFIAEKT